MLSPNCPLFSLFPGHLYCTDLTSLARPPAQRRHIAWKTELRQAPGAVRGKMAHRGVRETKQALTPPLASSKEMSLGRRSPLQQGPGLGRSGELFRACTGEPGPQTPATTHSLGVRPLRPRSWTAQPLPKRRPRRPFLPPPRLTCRVIRDLIFCMSKSWQRSPPRRTNKSQPATGL